MILDNEQQRRVLLELINGAQIPGAALEVVYGLKAAILAASVADDPRGMPGVALAQGPRRMSPEELASASN